MSNNADLTVGDVERPARGVNVLSGLLHHKREDRLHLDPHHGGRRGRAGGGRGDLGLLGRLGLDDAAAGVGVGRRGRQLLAERLLLLLGLRLDRVGRRGAERGGGGGAALLLLPDPGLELVEFGQRLEQGEGGGGERRGGAGPHGVRRREAAADRGRGRGRRRSVRGVLVGIAAAAAGVVPVARRLAVAVVAAAAAPLQGRGREQRHGGRVGVVQGVLDRGERRGRRRDLLGDAAADHVTLLLLLLARLLGLGLVVVKVGQGELEGGDLAVGRREEVKVEVEGGRDGRAVGGGERVVGERREGGQRVDAGGGLAAVLADNGLDGVDGGAVGGGVDVVARDHVSHLKHGRGHINGCS